MKEITYAEARALASPVFIDVRAPVEFAQDHIPGAINIPLFDDLERAEVGTIYRRIGSDEAILRGSEIAGGKLGEIVARIRRLPSDNLVINCFRGGMRSSTLAAILDSLAIKNIYKLEGGYKEYRRHVGAALAAHRFSQPVYVVQGLTGTGKTAVVRALEHAIDLEELAGHRSSVFGGMGMVPHSQKRFESLLLAKLESMRDAPYVVFEGEARKIGDLFVPDCVVRAIAAAPTIMLVADIERRIDIILEEYEAHIEPAAVSAIVRSLEGRIGKKTAAELLDALDGGRYREFVRVLLERYYDARYAHSFAGCDIIAEVENADTAAACRAIERIIAERPGRM